MEDDKTNHILLNDLPTEILLQIFKHVDVKTLHISVYNVSVRFRSILDDTFFWRKYFYEYYGDHSHVFSLVETDPDLDNDRDWHELLYQSTVREHLWSKVEKNCLTFTLSNHDASVDSLHLMEHGTLVVSGSRDRVLAVCNLRNTPLDAEFDVKSCYVHSESIAHSGWIWSIASVGHDIYTGSWDHTIKLWTLENGSLQQKQLFKLHHPVLSLSANESMLAAGLWTNQIQLFDVRTGLECIHEYKIHRRAVLSVLIDDCYIFSASEDRSICVYDHRAKKRLNSITIGNHSMAKPSRICYDSGILFVGDTRGCVHIIQTQIFNRIARLKVYDKIITGIAHEPGMLAIASADGEITLNQPTVPLVSYATIKPKSGNPVSMSYSNDTLAVGSSDGAVHIWLPKTTSMLD